MADPRFLLQHQVFKPPIVDENWTRGFDAISRHSGGSTELSVGDATYRRENRPVKLTVSVDIDDDLLDLADNLVARLRAGPPGRSAPTENARSVLTWTGGPRPLGGGCCMTLPGAPVVPGAAHLEMVPVRTSSTWSRRRSTNRDGP